MSVVLVELALLVIGLLIGSLLGHLYGYYAALDDLAKGKIRWPNKENPQ